MEFTQKEMVLIAKAGRKARDAHIVRLFLLIGMLVGLALMLAGVVGSDHYAYGLVVAVFIAVAHPQLGGGPKYEDLADLLRRKSAGQQ